MPRTGGPENGLIKEAAPPRPRPPDASRRRGPSAVKTRPPLHRAPIDLRKGWAPTTIRRTDDTKRSATPPPLALAGTCRHPAAAHPSPAVPCPHHHPARHTPHQLGLPSDHIPPTP